MSRLIFLSHIHEERELALIFKDALVREFGGFVDIFVSSDGVTITAGTNFLREIENGLTTCIAGMYLISPKSVSRSWVNFELGALWIRNKLNESTGQPHIPTLPVCHSGMTLRSLPQPISNLNSVLGGNAEQLEFAFRSLQKAVGGSGDLRTDFSALAAKVNDFERRYTIVSHYKRLFQMISHKGDVSQYLTGMNPEIQEIRLKIGLCNNDLIKELKQLEANELAGAIKVTTRNPTLDFGQGNNTEFSAQTAITFLDVSFLRNHKNEIFG
ncbi:toll/interleukin-1 receptor domain-containing protein (plasmid) [Paenibacillus sp. S-38]|uniref:toll/interleukin-1 receptor domain-containing protein n=1 Tax=Paenibacillus sp. S-38 TaxID=3416710 RepID=UPI003CEC9F0C